MTAENFLVNDSGNGQAVEAICESFPQFDIVSTLTFIIKSYLKRKRKKLIFRRTTEDEKLDFPFHIVYFVGSIRKLKKFIFHINKISSEKIKKKSFDSI